MSAFLKSSLDLIYHDKHSSDILRQLQTINAPFTLPQLYCAHAYVVHCRQSMHLRKAYCRKPSRAKALAKFFKKATTEMVESSGILRLAELIRVTGRVDINGKWTSTIFGKTDSAGCGSKGQKKSWRGSQSPAVSVEHLKYDIYTAP